VPGKRMTFIGDAMPAEARCSPRPSRASAELRTASEMGALQGEGLRPGPVSGFTHDRLAGMHCQRRVGRNDVREFECRLDRACRD
jgi:hypothetical protein